MLITQEDVIDLAFNRDIEATRIKDADINVAEWKYIRPALTDSLYSNIINNVANYTTLLAFVKPALAYYVKYVAFEELAFELSDRGIFQLTSQDANGVSDTQRAAYKESVLVKANELISVAINYIVENDLPYYDRENATHPRIIGGFLVERSTGDVENNNPSVPTDYGTARVWLSGDTIYLQEKVNGIWTNTGTQWDV
jgi:uncharacterized membrane protein YidH (DUF202 family)